MEPDGLAVIMTQNLQVHSECYSVLEICKRLSGRHRPLHISFNVGKRH